MNNLIIRQFSKNDTEAALHLANEYAFFDGPLQEEDFAVTNSFPEGFLVCEVESNIVGLVYGYFKEVPKEVLKNWNVSKVASIELLVVDPAYGNQGLGSELLEQLIEVFRDAGTNLVLLTCPVQAESAKHLYEKVGFRVNAYHMRKFLV